MNNFLLGSYFDETTNSKYNIFQGLSIYSSEGRQVHEGTIEDSEGNFIQTVAIKSLNFTSNRLQNTYVKSEISILKTIKHKHTVKLITRLKQKCLNNDIIHYLVMEYCKDGDLAHYLLNKSLSESQIQDFFRQTLKGLIYLHSKNISHRDIKPSNLFLIDDIIKIADYGVSKKFGESMNLKTPFLGTFGFMAPEVYDNDVVYSIEADVFSLGITLFYLYFKRTPFPESIDQKDVAKIKRVYGEVLISGDKLFDEKVNICSEAKDLIRKMIDYKKENRITLLEITQHDYVVKKFQNKESKERIVKRIARKEAKEICVWQKCFENIFTFSELCVNKKVWITALFRICKEISDNSNYLYRHLKDGKKDEKFRKKIEQIAQNTQNNLISLEEKFLDKMRKKIILEDDFNSIAKKLLWFFRENIETKRKNDDFIQTIVWLVLMVNQKEIRKIKIKNMNQKEKEELLEKQIIYIDKFCKYII